jgi:PTH2 family peptidyl-tRNA hydrolase
MRGDIEMSSGKMASQACHASRLSMMRYLQKHPERAEEFLLKNSCGSMVVLKGKKESDLLNAYEQAKSLGFPCAKFEDSGHIHGSDFDGSPVLTAVAFGPASKESMRSFTKKFQVMK